MDNQVNLSCSKCSSWNINNKLGYPKLWPRQQGA